MISSYTANLAAFLTVERMQSPIERAWRTWPVRTRLSTAPCPVAPPTSSSRRISSTKLRKASPG
uniref:PBPe domain-containing protein n=1 Tax=Macrostomum lignano TaxID=282301 RepID=A0A1I8F391_9PLAT